MDANQMPNNDNIAARRDARRRKILENSKSRLTKITGREHTEEREKSNSTRSNENIQSQMIYPDPEIERDVYVPPPPSTIAPPFPPELFRDVDGMGSFDDQKQFLEIFNSLSQQQQQQHQQQNLGNANSFAAFAQFGNNFDGNAGANMFFSNPNNSESPQVPETPPHKIISTKIHIALLAILSYLFILLAPFHLNAFLIFLAWEVAEIFLLRQHESTSNGILNVVFVLAGVSPTKMNVFLKWIQLLNKVLRDVALFMFVFIFAHICRSYWCGIDLILLTESHEPHHDAVNIPLTMMNDDVFEKFDL